MAVGRTRSVSMLGLSGALVEIEADIGNGLPNVVIIGLPDSALSESQHRVRAAVVNSGLDFTGKRLTINLSPAALPKHGSAFDLGIALAVLGAAGDLSVESIGKVVHLGELALDGRLRPVNGILPSVLAASRAGASIVMVPIGNADEASLVPGVRVIGVASLRDAAIWHGGEFEPEPVEPILRAAHDSPTEGEADLSDVIGNEDAIEAMQIAAAGGHHVFLLGPPGAGKTMLASRLPGLLPDLGPDAALEVSSLRSLSGLPVGASLITRPPLESPHHTATAASIIGGGSGIIRPGAAARASHGVLFMDEAPEFAGSVLDALRQPLESGVISIHRANAVAHFPGRFQLVLAANPCPCGQYGARDSDCTCAPHARRRYLARISGPLLDRIDIQLRVSRITSAQLRVSSDTAVHTTSASVRSRVVAARGAAAERLTATPWSLNSEVPGSWLRGTRMRPTLSTTAAIDRALERGGLTMRGYDRVLKLRCIGLGHTCSMTAAAIYMRQSLDRDNRQEGIARQRQRCRDLAAARGWEVVDEYIDNDVSASKPRGAGTAWHKLISDAKGGRVEVVVAVDQDRLMRGLRDLVTLVDTGIKVATVDGELDLTSADGEFRATLAAGLARFEVARKSERQKRANQHGRSLGVPAGGRRAFGYTPLVSGARSTTATRQGGDGRSWPAYGHEPYEPEASAVRRGYDMLLAGASLRSIARAWNEAGLTTTVEHAWEPYAVRGVLANPRYAALVAPPRSASTATSLHNLGLSDLPAGTWEPLVSPETWLAARDMLSDPARRANVGAVPRWLLSGLATCAVCGAPMKAGATRNKVKVYRCSSRDHLSRKADDADHYIIEVVLERLSRDDASDLLANRDAPDVDRLRSELREAQQGEANVLSMVARGLTSMATAEATLRDVRQRIGVLEAAMSDAGRVDVLGPLVTSDDVREVWRALDIDRRRAVVRALMAIELRSPGKGSRPPRDPAGRLAHTRDCTPLSWHDDSVGAPSELRR